MSVWHTAENPLPGTPRCIRHRF